MVRNRSGVPARRWTPEPGPMALGLVGAVLTLMTTGVAYTLATQGEVVHPLAVLPLTLAAAAGGAVHAFVYGRSREWTVWGLPVYLVLAGWLAGLAGGAIVATYSVVLVPSLLGFPDLNRMILDLQPPYTTPLIALVTFWALIGIGTVTGGVVGAAGAIVGMPVLLPLWWMARVGRWLGRPRQLPRQDQANRGIARAA